MNKHFTIHTGGDFFFFLQISPFPSFSTSIDSAFDTESIDTKIYEKDEIFQKSDIVGRHKISTSSPQITSFNSTFNTKINDKHSYVDSPLLTHNFHNIKKSRHKLVGPTSDSFNPIMNNFSKPLINNRPNITDPFNQTEDESNIDEPEVFNQDKSSILSFSFIKEEVIIFCVIFLLANFFI